MGINQDGYKLLKDFEDPSGKIYAGVIKTEAEWMQRFGMLEPGDCDIKDDWFKNIDGRYEMCSDQPAQIDCRLTSCRHHNNAACTNVSPAITLDADGKWRCHSAYAEKDDS